MLITGHLKATQVLIRDTLEMNYIGGEQLKV